MIIWDFVSGIANGIIDLAELMAGLLLKGVIFLVKLWFNYLVAFVTSGSELSFIGIGFLLFSSVAVAVCLFYLLKYMGIWGLIIVPVLLFLLKFFIILTMVGIMYVLISNTLDKIKLKLKGGNSYV